MRISCEHHHPKSHISQGYLATELQSPGAGGGPGRERCGAAPPGALGPRAPTKLSTGHCIPASS